MKHYLGIFRWDYLEIIGSGPLLNGVNLYLAGMDTVGRYNSAI